MSRSAVREALVWDHCYVAALPDDFKALLPLVSQFEGSSHQKIEAKDDAWEGIYLVSRTGAYFEILKEEKSEVLGLCFGAPRPPQMDVAAITQELSQLPWRRGKRSWPDGRPWYEWFSLDNYDDFRRTFFNAWIMKYVDVPKDQGAGPHKSPIEHFTRLHLQLGQEHGSAVMAASAWLPGRREQVRNHISFDFADRDGAPANVTIELVPGSQKFVFHRIDMSLLPGHSLKSQKFGRYSLEIQGNSGCLRLGQ